MRVSEQRFYGRVAQPKLHLYSPGCPYTLRLGGISVADLRTESELLDLRSL